MKIEYFNDVYITYMRAVGEYGEKNHDLMDSFKKYLKKYNLMNDSLTILGIAMDNPQTTSIDELRYDVGIVSTSSNSHLDFPTRKIDDGEYAVFEVLHTNECVENFWRNIGELGSNLDVDFNKPVIERYSLKMIKNHLCEFCIPLKT